MRTDWCVCDGVVVVCRKAYIETCHRFNAMGFVQSYPALRINGVDLQMSINSADLECEYCQSLSTFTVVLPMLGQSHRQFEVVVVVQRIVQ